MPAGEELPTSLIDLFGEALKIVVGTAVDDRSKIGVAFCRVADDKGIRLCLELADQFIVDRLFNEDARGSGTFLSLQTKRRADDAGRGIFEVGVARDDRRVLSAEFQDHRADVV